MSSQGSLPGRAVNDPSSSSAACAASSSSSNRPATLIPYKTVWDFEKIEKRGGPDSFSKVWHCGWCGMTLRGWNATKALNHVSKAAGNNDVKACTGAIPKATLATFQAFRFEKLGSASVKKQLKEAISDTVSHNQHSLSLMFGMWPGRKELGCSKALEEWAAISFERRQGAKAGNCLWGSKHGQGKDGSRCRGEEWISSGVALDGC